MEQEGLFFLLPVYTLLFGDGLYEYLKLPRSSVSVCYKTYYNTYKRTQISPNELSLQNAVDQGLTPGIIKTVKQN